MLQNGRTSAPTKSDLTAASSLDLLRCDAEPVHVPGAIQPHGVLIALDAAALTVVGLSTNAEAMLGLLPEHTVGFTLASLAQILDAGALAENLARAGLEERNPFKLSLATGETFDAIAHRHEGRIILECEPENVNAELVPKHLYSRVHSALVRLRATSSIEKLCAQVASEVRALTGFDRVLIYAFKPDWSGEVVAEDCRGEAAYLGLRFPASDIPAQARALYRSCRLRMIPTAIYEPAALVVLEGEPPIDLTHAVLRAISPVHLEYMRNMGVTASMGISLMRGDQLWGLVTCNHESGALMVSYEVRAACALLGEVVSSLIDPKERSAAAELRVAFQDIQAKLLQHVAQDADVVRGLTEHSPSILDVTGASGAALSYGGALHLMGATPSREAVDELLAWLEEQGTESLITESLPSLYPTALAWKDVGCGLVASSISFADDVVVSHKSWLLWFRPEVAQTVSWGGDPNKPNVGGQQRLSPRTSFALWKEDVHLRSSPFKRSDVAAGMSLAAALADVVIEIEASRKIRKNARLLEDSHRKLVEQIAANQRVEIELRRAQKLESVGRLAAGIAHEINTPLQYVNSNVELLQDLSSDLRELASSRAGDSVRLESMSAEMGSAIADSLEGLDRVSAIVRALTSFAHPDAAEKSVGDINEAIRVTVKIARGETRDVADVRLDLGSIPPIPILSGDINQVFLNLIVNAAHAIKDTLGGARTRGVIAIKTWVEGTDVIITVSDDGGGIPTAIRESVFLPFFTTKEVGRGTGQGLAICHAVVVDKHDGSLTFESEVGHGTTFRVRLPIPDAGR